MFFVVAETPSVGLPMTPAMHIPASSASQINFLASQPDFNFHNPDVQDWLLSKMRFWLERGVDGFRLDTSNFYFHDAQLRSNPPLASNDPLPTVNPYEMQDHLYSISAFQCSCQRQDRFAAYGIAGWRCRPNQAKNAIDRKSVV